MTHEYFVSFARIASSGGGIGFSYATFTLDQPMSADALKQGNDMLAERSTRMTTSRLLAPGSRAIT